MTTFILLHGSFHAAWNWHRLAAYLVPNGKAMMDYAVLDTESLVVQNVTPRLPPWMLRWLLRVTRHRTVRRLLAFALPSPAQRHVLKPEVYREALYHDCGDEITELANVLLEPEPNWSGFTPLRLSASRYGCVPKVYIECSQDRAVTPKLQRLMLKETPCDRVFSMETSHSPFFSQPSGLVDLLLASLQVFHERRLKAGSHKVRTRH
jgi:hypothetical protein